MRGVRRVKLGWGAALLCAARPAPAEPASSYSLSWVRAEGADECPAAHALANEVERRLGRPVFDARAARSFEVQVTRVTGLYRSEVFVRDEQGRSIGHRTLQSDEPGCTALFGATALAIALVIDPDAAATNPQASAAFEAPLAPPPPPIPPLMPAPSPVAREVTPPQPRVAPAAPSTPITIALSAQLSGALVPSVSPGVGLAFSARPWSRWGWSLMGSSTAAQTVRASEGVMDVGLTRVTGAVTFDVGQSERVRFIVHGGPTLGALHVAVREPAPVLGGGDFWFAGVELGVDVQLSVSKGLFVALGGAGLVALRRQEFLARGEPQPLWVEPRLSGVCQLGLGARFP